MGDRGNLCCISCCLNWKKPSFLEKNSPFSEDIFPRKTTKNGLKPGNPGNKPFSDWQGQKDLNPRHAVLEWMWENAEGSGGGAVLADSCRKSQNGRCWFGAAWKNPAAESVERPGKGLVHIVSHEIVRRAGRYVVERLYPLAVNGGRVWVSHARPEMHRIIPGVPLE